MSQEKRFLDTKLVLELKAKEQKAEEERVAKRETALHKREQNLAEAGKKREHVLALKKSGHP